MARVVSFAQERREVENDATRVVSSMFFRQNSLYSHDTALVQSTKNYINSQSTYQRFIGKLQDNTWTRRVKILES